ncbi:MAG: hypothetical protein V1872_09050 [bacterium]
MKRKKVLFIPGAFALAHVARLLVLAKTLNQEAYDILFAVKEQYKDLIEEAGLAYYPI